MALVAYSDESDYSEAEVEDNINPDDEKTLKPVKQLITSIREPCPLTNKESQFDMDEDTDIVNDVPTVKTWDISKKVVCNDKPGTDNIFTKNNIKKNKVKLILPALSEYYEDDEDGESGEETSSRKKLKSSNGGTGLFSVLPKPRGSTFLVPQHVARKKERRKPESVQRPKPDLSTNDSDEEEDISKSNSNDFFSLSISPTSTLSHVPCSLEVPLSMTVPTSSKESPSFHIPSHQEEPDTSQVTFIPLESSNAGIDEEAFRRLSGRRRKGEIPQIIDIHADDALMPREEWVTRALCDEKPRKSFSKKKEGNPTQQQKRKHQITYLAHQAQEREQDLQNTWGQNRFTKMQTQSKYGF